MNITADHWLEGVQRVPLSTVGGEMRIRRCVVNHFTGGADGDGDTNGDHIKDAYSAPDAMRDRGLSAHVVIDRDGTIIQCVPFNRIAFHAGVSRWRDPKTGILYNGANNYSIGIEIANAGDDVAGAMAWARRHVPGFSSIRARHRNGDSEREWESFYEPQIAAVIAVNQAVVIRYRLDDVTGHDCIAPERKNDPGPAFPMERVRIACGFSGLPKVNNR